MAESIALCPDGLLALLEGACLQFKPRFVWGNFTLPQNYPRRIQSTMLEIRLSYLRHFHSSTATTPKDPDTWLWALTEFQRSLITHRSTGRADTVVPRVRLTMKLSRLLASKSLHHATRRLCHDTAHGGSAGALY
jgi:hypothetical protein